MASLPVKSHVLRVVGWTICLVVLLMAPRRSVAADKSGADDLAATRQQLYTSYSAQLRDLAVWCDANGLAKQAEFTRAWLPQRESSMIYVFTLPDSSEPPAKLTQEQAAEGWWKKFMDLRRAQADKLFALAQTALKAQQPALAFELGRETVRENPNHEAGRKALGQQRHGDRWVSSETAKRLDVGQVWSNVAGWIPADQAKRYEQGERFYRGQWISATDDARLHSNIFNAWQVESDHYLVVTNQSLEEGVRLSKRLETLYDVWRQAFLMFYAKPSEVEHWFVESSTSTVSTSTVNSGSHKPHQVIYFHDKQQYVDSLKTIQPHIDKSLGFYSAANKSAYFFAGDEQYDGTIYHEATHQLFQEMRTAVPDPGRKNNFWIYEGAACYMESLTEHPLIEGETYGMYITLGGENSGRVPAARKRLLDDNFYVPFRELVTVGRQDFQQDPRIAPLYSQIAGQTYFLMHAQQARYRPALVEYLIALYTGHTTPETLQKLTGVKYEDLDRQYREFLK